jgi:Flp pilus assembly protein TadB
MTWMLAILAFLLTAAGVAMAVVFAVGTTKPRPPASAMARRMRAFWLGAGLTRVQRRVHQTLLLSSAVAGLVTWLFTGWFIGGVIVALAVPGIPWLFSASGAEKRAIAKLSALEAWTRRIADYVRTGIGLQAAIIATARSAPPLIGPEVRTLAARLQAGSDPEQALRAFADELDDYSCDEVVAPLILQLNDAGEGLDKALTDVAQGLSEEVSTRATVDGERATARYTVRFLTGATIAVLAFGAINTVYAAPYKTFLGQVILVALAALYVTLMLWIRALSLPQQRARLLGGEGR